MRFQNLELQTKVIAILIVVIFPVSILFSAIQSRLIAPVFDEEMKQVGMSFTQTLQNRLEATHAFKKTNAPDSIEDQIQRLMYSQPSVLRADIIRKKADGTGVFYFASSVEDEGDNLPEVEVLSTKIEIKEMKDDAGPVLRILYPMTVRGELYNIHVLVSLRLSKTLRNVLFRFNLVAAFLSTIILILLLSYFLRRAIENEKELKLAQSKNKILSTQVLELQRELIHSEKLAAMGQLTASFAHEIGTPLNAMGGHLQILISEIDKENSTSRLQMLNHSQIIFGQISKIESIVKNFLQNTTKPDSTREVLSSHQLVEKVLELVSPTLANHKIEVQLHLNAEKDEIKVAPIEIEQVILNLVNNAVDAIRESRRTKNYIKISSSVEEVKGVAHIKYIFQDTGVGISDENRKRIFRPFFTTKPFGEGHGLGLAICLEIIESYEGSIRVESAPDGGSLFVVTLPLAIRDERQRS